MINKLLRYKNIKNSICFRQLQMPKVVGFVPTTTSSCPVVHLETVSDRTCDDRLHKYGRVTLILNLLCDILSSEKFKQTQDKLNI